MIGLLFGVIFALMLCVGGPFVAYRVHVNQMEKEHEQYVSEVGARFDERLRELRIEAGLNPETGSPEVIDMSWIFQKD